MAHAYRSLDESFVQIYLPGKNLITFKNTFLLPYPKGYLWDDPGVYSMTVPYAKSNDFFYSGHISTAVICIMEFRSNKEKFMLYFSIATLIVQIALMVALRGHYMIDLLAGLIFGHYFFIIAEHFSWILDEKIFNIPFFKRFPHLKTSCGRCKKDLTHFKSKEKKEKTNLKYKNPEMVGDNWF